MRYVLPFREGGSVPALVEADDSGMYVTKLRGASQGAMVALPALGAAHDRSLDALFTRAKYPRLSHGT